MLGAGVATVAAKSLPAAPAPQVGQVLAIRDVVTPDIFAPYMHEHQADAMRYMMMAGAEKYGKPTWGEGTIGRTTFGYGSRDRDYIYVSSDDDDDNDR